MNLELNGKVALITGATSGIGRATALRLATEGVKVCLVARSADRLAEVADSIRRDGADVRTVGGDLRNGTLPETAVNSAVKAFGRLDVLVNAAGHIAVGTVLRIQRWMNGTGCSM